MAVVKAKPGQSSDAIIRAFQKMVQNEDIMGEVERRKFYRKPALVRKAKADARKHPNRKVY